MAVRHVRTEAGALRWELALVAFSALAPFSIFSVLLSADPLQHVDYWIIITSIFNPDGTLRLRGFVEVNNEHFVPLSKLLIAANAMLFDGVNWTLAFTACGVYCLSAFALFFSLEREGRYAPALVAGAILAALFTPHGIHNFVQGMSASIQLLSLAFCIFALCAFSRGRYLLGLLSGCVACGAGGTGIAVWPALLVQSISAQRPRWVRWATILLAVAWLLVLAFVSRTPSHHEAPFAAPLVMLTSFVTLIGASLTTNPQLAAFLGAFILVAAAWQFRDAWQEDSLERALLVFGLAAAILITVLRARFGVEAFMASRFGTTLGVFWLAFFLTLIRSSWRGSRIALAGLILVSFVGSEPRVAAYQDRRLEYQLSSIALRNGGWVKDTVALPMWNDARQAHLVSLLTTLQQYPFRPQDSYSCNLEGQRVTDVAESPQLGRVDSAYPWFRPGVQRIAGWTSLAAEEIDCIVITNDAYEVIGAAVPGKFRADVNAALDRPAARLGWAGVAIADGSEGFHVLVRPKGNSKFRTIG